jgi:hypothetical protein
MLTIGQRYIEGLNNLFLEGYIMLKSKTNQLLSVLAFSAVFMAAPTIAHSADKGMSSI